MIPNNNLKSRLEKLGYNSSFIKLECPKLNITYSQLEQANKKAPTTTNYQSIPASTFQACPQPDVKVPVMNIDDWSDFDDDWD